jgi:hypothetical protein
MKPIRQINPALSEGLEEVILRATQQDPNKRYADCAEMAYALRHYRDRDAAHNRAFRRRVRIFNGLVIAAVVCLVLGLACIPAGNASRNKDYDYWMQTGAQSTNDATAEQAYRNATKAKSDSIEPYEKLIALYEKEREKNAKLLDELEQCKADRDKFQKQIEELEVQMDNLHLAEAFKAQTDSNDGAKEKIDSLIKEIDRCIALLEK